MKEILIGIGIVSCFVIVIVGALVLGKHRQARADEEAGGRFGATVSTGEARVAARDHEERIGLLEAAVERLEASEKASGPSPQDGTNSGSYPVEPPTQGVAADADLSSDNPSPYSITWDGFNFLVTDNLSPYSITWDGFNFLVTENRDWGGEPYSGPGALPIEEARR